MSMLSDVIARGKQLIVAYCLLPLTSYTLGNVLDEYSCEFSSRILQEIAFHMKVRESSGIPLNVTISPHSAQAYATIFDSPKYFLP